jgi:hypothetical protein
VLGGDVNVELLSLVSLCENAVEDDTAEADDAVR